MYCIIAARNLIALIDNQESTVFVGKPADTILRRAGVRYRNPYQTRHTFASQLLISGEPELLVAKLLGHTTTEMGAVHTTARSSNQKVVSSEATIQAPRR